MNSDPDRVFLNWHTVSVTALPPGWRNVFRDDDALITSICPAILLQEHRSTDYIWDVPASQGRIRKETRPEKPPYRTRAVFADFEGVELAPADMASNYVATIGPGEEPSKHENDAPL